MSKTLTGINPVSTVNGSCDICGEKLSNIAGMKIKMGDSHIENDLDFVAEKARFKDIFGKLELNSCMCCFALNSGFKPVDKVRT